MLDSPQAKQDQISNLAAKAHALGIMPDTALKVVRLAGDPEAETSEIAAAFHSDPLMAARLLKVANSAYYGLRNNVSTISHAITLLGVNTIRNIALASSVGPLARGLSMAAGFSPKVLMRHLLYTAAAAAELANEVDGADSDEAFLAGMLHDIGLILEAQVDLNGFLDAVRSWNRDGGAVHHRLLESERECLSINHTELAAEVCRLWGLPEQVREAIRAHHVENPASQEISPLTRIVLVADQLDYEYGDHGIQGQSCEPMSDETVSSILGINIARIPRIRQRIVEAAAEVVSMFY